MSNLYSKAKLNQIPSPSDSIEKYQSLIIDFQLTAQYLNPVDIKTSRANIFIKHFLEKNMMLPAFCYQQIFNKAKWHARFSPTKEKNYAEQIPLKTPNDAVFAKSFSLNDGSLILRFE
jgi:hypothetical protein